MPRLSIESRRMMDLRSLGYSVNEIQERLTDEEIHINTRAIHLLVKKKKKYWEKSTITDIWRPATAKKLNNLQIKFIDNCMVCGLVVREWPHKCANKYD